jgi:signal transduction histidine kinase/HD-like signal output (HDOD) protein
MLATEPSKPRRIELILRQIDSLPTLPAVAARLLSLTSSDDSNARQVIELVSADPSLTAKVLSLCRSADKGVGSDNLTVDRAVVLLGFNAIRNAVLSVKVFELFGPDAARPGAPGEDAQPGESDHLAKGNRPDKDPAPPAFDRSAFWMHCLAVGVAAEMIAKAHPRRTDLAPDEAFVCGLLHDIGKVALDYILPRSFDRVVELTDLNQANIAEFERRIIGIDHHTAGKRLAQQWRLPHMISDCIWLHGSSFDTLPRLEHVRMIGLISLADLIARRMHAGYSGNYSLREDVGELAQKLELDPDAVAGVADQLHEQLEIRGKALGLYDAASHELLLQSVQRANEALGRINAVLDQRARDAEDQVSILDTITAFHGSATPGRSVQDVLDAVVGSCASLLGPGFYGAIYPGSPDAPGTPGTDGQGEDSESDGWLICQYNQDGRPVHSQYIQSPPHTPDLSALDPTQPVGLQLMGILPWVADYIVQAPDLRSVRLLPLSCGWGASAVLLHDREKTPPWKQLSAMTSTWGAAVAAAAQHDGARRLGEDLATTNLALAEAQDQLTRQASLARLGEMAAGAAHEMNNPLAVIAGRSQLLAMTLDQGSREQKAAQLVFQESHKLSSLITSLRLIADPPAPNRVPTDLGALLDETVKQFKSSQERQDRAAVFSLKLRGELPTVQADPEQVRGALRELLNNAVQSDPASSVQVTARVEPGGETVVVQVIDDGEGMDPYTLEHAPDPFFSAKTAGRRVGMGLPRARQWLSGHGGRLELRSRRGEGTVATFFLPLDSPSG